jgi:hypothetical protein
MGAGKGREQAKYPSPRPWIFEKRKYQNERKEGNAPSFNNMEIKCINRLILLSSIPYDDH